MKVERIKRRFIRGNGGETEWNKRYIEDMDLNAELIICDDILVNIEDNVTNFADVLDRCKWDVTALNFCKNVRFKIAPDGIVDDQDYWKTKTVNALMRLAISYGSDDVIAWLYKNMGPYLKRKRIVKYAVYADMVDLVMGLDTKIDIVDVIFRGIKMGLDNWTALHIDKLVDGHQYILEYAAIYDCAQVIRTVLNNTELKVDLREVYNEANRCNNESIKKILLTEYSFFLYPNFWSTDEEWKLKRVLEINHNQDLDNLFDVVKTNNLDKFIILWDLWKTELHYRTVVCFLQYQFKTHNKPAYDAFFDDVYRIIEFNDSCDAAVMLLFGVAICNKSVNVMNWLCQGISKDHIKMIRNAGFFC